MMPWAGLFSLGKGLIGLADQFIEDKDKRLEFQARVMERTFDMYERLLATPTSPRMDAFIKLAMTWNLVLKGMFRPLGSFCLAAFAGWMAARGTPLPDYLAVALFGAPIAWGASRHVEKKRKGAEPEDPFAGYNG